MSVNKFSKHQRSSKPKVVLTKPDGEILTFDSHDEYLNSDYRRQVKATKKKRQERERLLSESHNRL